MIVCDIIGVTGRLTVWAGYGRPLFNNNDVERRTVWYGFLFVRKYII